MGYPSKASSYPDLKKTDGHNLKLVAEQLKYVFATKTDLKDKNLEREIRHFLSLTFKTIHH